MKNILKDADGRAMLTVIAMCIFCTLLSSCANEKKFVRYHNKHEVEANGHCWVWNPTKDSVHESVSYLPGEPQIIPGETIYANCDSAYEAALNEMANAGVKIVVKKVAVPCPPSTVITNTVTVTKTETVRYTAVEDMLKAKLNKETGRADTNHKWAIGEAWVIAVLLLLIAVYGYGKISDRV